jgi:hypothetical protein
MIDHVRSVVIEYLAGLFTTDELAIRLPDGYELDEASDPAALDMTLRSVGYLAELERGDRTEDELRAALIPLVQASETVSPTLTADNTQVTVLGAMSVAAVTLPADRPLLEVSG